MILTRHEFRVGAGVVLWLGAIGAGFAAWETYDTTAGDPPRPLRTQPPRPSGRWRLVMFAHPRCECTRASLSELREILGRNTADLDVRVVFVRPKGVPPGWEQDDLWASASEIPGVRVECDAEGNEARCEGANVSGHVVLYDPAGAVAFEGGITRSRGRVGDSAGRQAILALLRGESANSRETPTFGCPLLTSRECSEKEGKACQR